MKKIALSAFLSFISIVAASEAPFDGTHTIYEKNPHRIYFGPEVFFLDLKMHIDCAQIKCQTVFSGISLGYEYLKPKRIYAGIELMAATTDDTFEIHLDGKSIESPKVLIGFGWLDLQVGYTFSLKNGIVTPFLAIGNYFFDSEHHDNKFEQINIHAGGGIRSQHGITPFFNLGLNLRIFWSKTVETKVWDYSIRYKEGEHMWGGAIGLPLMWHVGAKKRWDIQFEPYFTALDFSKTRNIYGTRLLFGYRF